MHFPSEILAPILACRAQFCLINTPDTVAPSDHCPELSKIPISLQARRHEHRFDRNPRKLANRCTNAIASQSPTQNPPLSRSSRRRSTRGGSLSWLRTQTLPGLALLRTALFRGTRLIGLVFAVGLWRIGLLSRRHGRHVYFVRCEVPEHFDEVVGKGVEVYVEFAV